MMNSLKIVSIILCILFILPFCSNKVSDKKVENKTIKIVKSKEIFLDTGEDLIGFAMDIKILNKNILVVDPIRSKKCFYFDENGKLLFMLGLRGQGPGEVPIINAACISGERIFVLGIRRLNIYSKKDGNEIKTTKKPFRSLCTGVYPGSNGSIYLLSFNRYNKNKNTIYHIDKNGELINSFGKIEDIPKVFDTFFPASNLLVDDNIIYQSFNFKYEIYKYNYNGKTIDTIKLNSPFYTKPNIKNAKLVKRRDELKFRSSFTQISGIFKHSQGFVTVLTNWKNIKTNHIILELWDNDFVKIGSCEFNESEDIVHYQDNMLLTLEPDKDTQRLVFWDIIVEDSNNKIK